MILRLSFHSHVDFPCSLSRAQSNHRMDASIVQSNREKILSQLQSLYSGSQGKIGTLYEEDPLAPVSGYCICTCSQKHKNW